MSTECRLCGKVPPDTTRVTMSVLGAEMHFCSTDHFAKFAREMKLRSKGKGPKTTPGVKAVQYDQRT